LYVFAFFVYLLVMQLLFRCLRFAER